VCELFLHFRGLWSLYSPNYRATLKDDGGLEGLIAAPQRQRGVLNSKCKNQDIE
jgi:hypothetical protein